MSSARTLCPSFVTVGARCFVMSILHQPSQSVAAKDEYEGEVLENAPGVVQRRQKAVVVSYGAARHLTRPPRRTSTAQLLLHSPRRYHLCYTS